MKKLTRQEMKNVMGGNEPVNGGNTICVSCMDTPGYWNSQGNVLCSTVPAGFTCTESYGTGSNGISCGNAGTMTYFFTACPVA